MHETTVINTSPVTGTIRELQPIWLLPVSNLERKDYWNTVVSRYHYLGHKNMPGRQIKYLAFSGERPIAALSFRACALKLEVRDCFIGWSKNQRRQYRKHILNNNRFLIFPWVSVRNLGSYLLASAVRRISSDWQKKYECEPWLLETFVDPECFEGTIYSAANWTYLGETKGYSKEGQKFIYHGRPKEVFVYILRKDFRELLGTRPAPIRRRYTFRRERIKMLNYAPGDWSSYLFEGIDFEDTEWLADRLDIFHRKFSSCFNHPKQEFYSLTYLRGLLSDDLNKKTAETIALRYLGKNKVRYLQKFLTESPWDDCKMQEIIQQEAIRFLDHPQGMINIDSSEMEKRGSHSVGVAHQYCGRLGKLANCQSGVFIGYSSSKGYTLLDQRLYMPKQWFEDEYAQKREDCRVPQDLKFKTKQDIAIELLQNLPEFQATWIGMDSFFGRDYELRKAVGARLNYFASVPCDTRVWLKRPRLILPDYKGRGPRPKKKRPETKPLRVDELKESEHVQWKEVALNEGSRGIITAKVAMLRVVECVDGMPKQEVWLVMRKHDSGKVKYFLCNAPEDIAKEYLLQALIMRWPIEQTFELGKSELGMADYECRSWPAWHRHMAHVSMALLFLLFLQDELRPDCKDSQEKDNSVSDEQKDTSRKKKGPALNLVRIQKLLSAALEKIYGWATSAKERLLYYFRNTYKSYMSRKRKQEREFARRGLYNVTPFSFLEGGSNKCRGP